MQTYHGNGNPFCMGFENLSLTKINAKKIATDSRFPAPK